MQKEIKKHVIVVTNLRIIWCLFLCFIFFGCGSTLQKVNSNINDSFGVKFSKSKNERSVFIRETRSEFLKSFFLKEGLEEGEYYFFEHFNVLFTPYTFSGAVKKTTEKDVYIYVLENSYIQEYDKIGKDDVYGERYYKVVFGLMSLDKFNEIEKLHEDEDRKRTDPGINYIYILRYKKGKEIELVKSLRFEAFALKESELYP